MSEFNEFVATRIREIRKQQKLTQRRLAEMMGHKHPFVADIETQRVRINIDDLQEFSRFFRVSVHTFLPQDNPFSSREMMTEVRQLAEQMKTLADEMVTTVNHVGSEPSLDDSGGTAPQ